MKEINVDTCHEHLRDTITQKLAFDPSVPLEEWRGELRERFTALTGLDKIARNICDINFQIEETVEFDEYTRVRFTIDSEACVTVPCYLLLPREKKEKYPLVITIQGHSSGMYNSIGEIRSPEDEEYQPRGSFALQAVMRGYIALAIEQRGMGEQQSPKINALCSHVLRTALLLGRTVIGERVWDVKRAIDAVLERYPEIDRERIAVTGNSGGGTTSFYAACYDERISLSVPSCSFCPYKESILSIAHCGCNYIPNAYEWFEMQDLAGLIAPRRLTVVTGALDGIFPIDGVKRGFETVQRIYSSADAPDNCKLTVTPMGHWWCEDIVWGEIEEALRK